VPFVLPAMCGGMYLKVEGRYTRLQRGDFGPLVALVPKGQHDTVNFEFIIQSGVSIIQYYIMELRIVSYQVFLYV